MVRCVWETVRTFSENDKQLRGVPGAIAVLHTHSRRLDFHPHVHPVMPAAALDAAERLWRTKTGKGKKPYLFNHKALAKVFRAKMLDAIRQEGPEPPSGLPEAWVVDVKSVGKGDKALVYLGRYLYKGVIQEKDIVACENGRVTFQYRDAKTKRKECRYLVKDFGTSLSPKSTRLRDSRYCPGRPASVPLRHTIASSAPATQHSHNGLTACRMRLHMLSAGYGTCGPFATPTIRTRLRLPGTTRLVLRTSMAGSVCFFCSILSK